MVSIRQKSLFYKKIKCAHCGCNYKLKSERGTNKYICSSYDNKGKCVRIPIKEEFLIELIEKRLEIPVNTFVVNRYVEEIIIEDFFLFEIAIYNQESIVFSNNGIKF